MKRIGFFSVFLLGYITFATAQNSEQRNKGYRGFADLGTHFGLGETEVNSVNVISTTHGYQFNPFIFLGAGAGINLSDYYATIPFFIDFKAKLLDGKASPLFGLKLGGHINDHHNIGYYTNPSIGVSFMISKRYSLNISGSLILWEDNEEYDSLYSAAGITVGLGF